MISPILLLIIEILNNPSYLKSPTPTLKEPNNLANYINRFNSNLRDRLMHFLVLYKNESFVIDNNDRVGKNDIDIIIHLIKGGKKYSYINPDTSKKYVITFSQDECVKIIEMFNLSSL